MPDDCKWTADAVTINNRPPVDYKIDVTYTYKSGYFNPWLHDELLKLFLRSKGLQEEHGRYYMGDGRKAQCKAMIFNKLIPDGSFNDTWKQTIRVNSWLEGSLDPYGDYPELLERFIKVDKAKSSNIANFNEFTNIIEEFFISGYDPGENVLNELISAYTPVKIIKKPVVFRFDREGQKKKTGCSISVYNESKKMIHEEKSIIYIDDFISFVKLFNDDIEDVWSADDVFEPEVEWFRLPNKEEFKDFKLKDCDWD